MKPRSTGQWFSPVERSIWISSVTRPLEGDASFWSRFSQVEKKLVGLAGEKEIPDVLRSALLGLDPAEFVEALREVDNQLARNADILSEGLRDLPPSLTDEPVIVGLGDSLTDDRASWFEHLRRVWDGGEFVNLARGGDTSADTLKLLAMVDEVRPDWALVLIGTNDTVRVGDQQLVSLEETKRNVAAIRRFLEARSIQQLWVTPTGVNEKQLAGTWSASDMGLRYSNSRLALVADVVRGLEGIVLVDAFSSDGSRWDFEDGIHPTVNSQCSLAALVLDELSRTATQ